jgi:hypothetical protein
MMNRDAALEKIRAIPTKSGTLAGYIGELALGGFFDAPAHSAEVIKAIKDQFGRRFPVPYLQTYMKPFLQAGALRAQESHDRRGNIWFGAWLADDEKSLRTTTERLRIKLDTTGWNAEVAEDFQLGIGCYSNKLWKPAAVMVRRAYEGALIEKYRINLGVDPEKQGKCPNCKASLGKRPLSITDLHYWAVGLGLVREKLDGLSVLLKDLGAGGAHPTKSTVIDPDTAEIIIKCGAVLLRDLHHKKPIRSQDRV